MAARSEAVSDDDSGTPRFVFRDDEDGGGSTNSARGTPSAFLEKDSCASVSEFSAVRSVALSPGGGGSTNSARGTLSCCARDFAWLCDAGAFAGGGSTNSALGASDVSAETLGGGDEGVLFAATTGDEAAGIGCVAGGAGIFSALNSLGEGFCGGGAVTSFVDATTAAVVAAGVTPGRGVAVTVAFDFASLGVG
jgi:hypothetical protein